MRELLDSPWKTLSIPSAFTHWRSTSLRPRPFRGTFEDVPVTSLTHLEHRETYGQTQGRSGGHQGSSVNRRYQLSFVGRLWYRRSPLPQGNRLLLNVSLRYRVG